MIELPNGERWSTVDEAAMAFGLRPGTLRVWATRGRIRSLRPPRGKTMVCLLDVMVAEREWRQRVRRRV